MQLKDKSYTFFYFIVLLCGLSSCSSPTEESGFIVNVADKDSVAIMTYIDAGNKYRIAGELDKAKLIIDSAKHLSNKLNWGQGLAESYNNLAYINLYESDFENSMENAVKALDIAEKTNDIKNQGFSNLLIGYVHFSLGDTALSLPYYQKSIALRKKLNNDYDLGFSYSYLGNLYLSCNVYDSALYYHQLSLEHRLKTEDSRSIADSYLLIGSTLFKQNLLDEALRHFELALSKYRQIDDRKRLAETYRNFAEVNLSKGDTLKAEEFLLEAYAIANSIGAVDNMIPISDQLSIVNNQKGNYKEAYDYLRYHLETKNKTSNNQKHREITKKILEYKAEKEKKIQELEYAQKEEKQQVIYQATSVLILFLIIFLLFVFNRLKITRRQKEIIADKKETVDRAFVELEEKNNEILDSINYAKRIQAAILPPDKLIHSKLKNAFVLYLPKDIVAGDFYWLEQKNDVLLFAIGDCTGHGVPGAMVSVICNNSLNRSVHEFELTQPNLILDKTREIVSKEFEKSEEDVKDGMDIALCAFLPSSSKKSVMVQYAGANNPLWIIRKDADEIEVIKPNSQAIGKLDDPTPFANNSITLNEGDSIYLFSDGFIDQFGGAKGKKYKAIRLRPFLLSIQKQSMEKQKELLHQEFLTWKGKIEQIDDICFMGIKI